MPVTRSASQSNQTTSTSPANHNASQQAQFKKRSTRKNDTTRDSTHSTSVAAPNISKKRAPSNSKDTADEPKKKAKLTKEAPQNEDDSVNDEESIKINRSPVLRLWACVVAAFLHPDESWDTCLSVGSSISTLCAVAKGKGIGRIEPKEKSAEEQRQKNQLKNSVKKDSYELEVMGFELRIKNGAVLLDGKPERTKESLLIGAFGGEAIYGKLKQVMEDALQSWNDDKDELNGKAFHMYEKFRPNTGWGRKGELKLRDVKEAIER